MPLLYICGGCGSRFITDIPLERWADWRCPACSHSLRLQEMKMAERQKDGSAIVDPRKMSENRPYLIEVGMFSVVAVKHSNNTVELYGIPSLTPDD